MCKKGSSPGTEVELEDISEDPDNILAITVVCSVVWFAVTMAMQ